MASQPYAGRELDGDSHFRSGMDSANDPDQLPAGMYARAFNAVKRGGKLQCRPGYWQRASLAAGMIQGAHGFWTTDNVPMLLVAIAGRVYRLLAPFDRLELIPDLQFAENARHVYFETAIWAVRRNEDGSQTLIAPRTVVIMQDGLSAPGYYDGSANGHIRGDFTTPLGTVMKWTGDRLWVARGRRLFASDIGNPFSFFEGEYIGPTGINSFILPDAISAMAEVTGVADPFLLVFTDRDGVAFQSNIRQRSSWASVPNFQKTILPGVGCVAHRSVVNTFGQLWWMSASGVVSLDIALAVNQESKLTKIDTNMAWSKRSLSGDLSGVCGGTIENYLLMSVPYADKFNRHTWVYDAAGLETNEFKQGPGWDAYWIGTRPVAWVTLNVDGTDRIFQFSHDSDGHNRLWEAFHTERKDNGCPISWGLETRGYTGGARNFFQFRYVDLIMSEFSGETEVSVQWAGTRRGRYKSLGSKIVSAEEGSVRFDVPIDASKECFFALKRQGRTLRSEEVRRQESDPGSSCDVESDREEPYDNGFQMFILCSGPGAIDAIRFFAQDENEGRSGECPTDESGSHRATRFDGYSARAATAISVLDKVNPVLVLYTATRSATVQWNGFVATESATRTSWLSQWDADRSAQCVATMRAAKKLEEISAPLFGGTQPDPDNEIVYGD
jgi:hypothetical protein